MESIEKLRRYQICEKGDMHTRFISADKIADEIEAEIERDYMKLPVDGDGAPIHVGDVMEQRGERIGTVTAVGKHKEARAWVLPDGKNVSISYVARGIRHVNPRTIEDVLHDVVSLCFNTWKKPSAFSSCDVDYVMASGNMDEFAKELRELMEVDE